MTETIIDDTVLEGWDANSASDMANDQRVDGLIRRVDKFDQQFERVNSRLDKIIEDLAKDRIELAKFGERLDGHVKYSLWGVPIMITVLGLILVQFNSKINSLDSRLGGIERDLASFKRAAVAESIEPIVNAAVSTLTPAVLQGASASMKFARQQRVVIPPENAKAIALKGIEASKSPEEAVASSAWGLVLESLSYRTTQYSSPIEIPKSQPADPLHSGHGPHSDYYAFNGPTGSPRVPSRLLILGKHLPIETAAIALPIGTASMAEGSAFGFEYVVAEGGAMILDGMHYRRVVFRNAHILYHGGSLILDNVFFLNCTFEMPRQERSLQIAESLVTSPQVSLFSANASRYGSGIEGSSQPNQAMDWSPCTLPAMPPRSNVNASLRIALCP